MICAMTVVSTDFSGDREQGPLYADGIKESYLVWQVLVLSLEDELNLSIP